MATGKFNIFYDAVCAQIIEKIVDDFQSIVLIVFWPVMKVNISLHLEFLVSHELRTYRRGVQSQSGCLQGCEGQLDQRLRADRNS
jgi:hypothetical protein